MISAFMCLLSITSYADLTTNISSPEQVVAEFQKLPRSEMFCLDESWNAGAAIPTIKKNFQSKLSKDLYKLFLWSECVEPEVPPHYGDLYNAFYYDIRFSIPVISGHKNNRPSPISDIRIATIKNNNPAQTIVRVDFSNKGTKMFTRYTLIQEDGSWKIDDISPQATFVNGRQPADNYGYEIADYNFSSDSIKTDMQKNYDAAMKRYTQEQGAKPKP